MGVLGSLFYRDGNQRPTQDHPANKERKFKPFPFLFHESRREQWAGGGPKTWGQPGVELPSCWPWPGSLTPLSLPLLPLLIAPTGQDSCQHQRRGHLQRGFDNQKAHNKCNFFFFLDHLYHPCRTAEMTSLELRVPASTIQSCNKHL